MKLTFKYPDLFPTLKFAKNPETRRRVYVDQREQGSFAPAPFLPELVKS